MRYRCLIFDHDDTAVNSTATIHHPAFLAFLRKYFPGRTCTLEDYFLKNFEPGFIEMCVDEYGMTDRDLETETNFWLDYVKNHVPEAYPGIPELLKKLRSAGIHLCVLSNKPHEISVQIVRQYFGENTFDIIMGKSPDYPIKPDPTSCFYLMKKLGLEKNDVLYVGDSNVDMQTAKNAGLTKCGVCWGFRSEAELTAEGADYLAHTSDDIYNLATGGVL